MKKSLVSMFFVLILMFTVMGSASAYEFKGMLPLNDKVSGSFADAAAAKEGHEWQFHPGSATKVKFYLSKDSTTTPLKVSIYKTDVNGGGTTFVNSYDSSELSKHTIAVSKSYTYSIRVAGYSTAKTGGSYTLESSVIQ
ncbi:hypothetical protein ACQCTA_03090 [Bacillus subtilis]|uniref:hypothetical protein n=1 Tax=Bacillus subtilis TaxID=1423 RepID=UPI003CEC09A6